MRRSSLLLAAAAGALATPDTAPGVIVRPDGQPATERPPLTMPPGWYCRAHSRQAAKAKLTSPQWGEALLLLLFRNERFARRCGWDPASGAKPGLAEAQAAIDALGPLCCYLSAPERREALRMAVAGEVEGEVKAQAERARIRQSLLAP